MSDIDEDVGDENPGEVGGPRVRGDLANFRLLKRALRNGWTVPDNFKQLAVLRMAGILKDGKNERGMTAAARALVSMTAADLSAIETAMRAKAQEEIETRLAALEERLGGKGVGR